MDGRKSARWRVGRKVGRTIYAVVEDDMLIGVMDTPALAREAVEAHNERLAHDVTPMRSYIAVANHHLTAINVARGLVVHDEVPGTLLRDLADALVDIDGAMQSHSLSSDAT